MMKQLLDELEPRVESGGVILDWHSCEVFPERWPDLVIVLRCDHTKLWDRLERRCVCAVLGVEFDNVDSLSLVLTCRGYPLKKIQENNEAEIMEVVLDEARSSYPAEVVVELKSESTDDLDANVARLVEWVTTWARNNGIIIECDT